MIRIHRLFPLALAILMAMLTIWLDQITRPQPHSRAPGGSRPEYQVEGFQATRFTVQGRINDNLSAERAWKYPNRPELYAHNAVLNVYDNGTLSYNIAGQAARYNTNTRVVVFEQQVIFFQPADVKRQATHVRTSALTVNTVEHTAASQAPVQIQYGNSTASSVGFNYNQRTGVLQLLSRAKATYVP